MRPFPLPLTAFGSLTALLLLTPSVGLAKAQPAPVGDLSVVSRPAGLPFSLIGPAEWRRGTTPLRLTDMPIGHYTVYYTLPSSCKPAAPLARMLQAEGNVEFVLESPCAAEAKGVEPPIVPGGGTEVGETAAPQEQPSRLLRRHRTVEHPLRVALETGGTEVTPGGSTQFSITILNRGLKTLRNLTVDYRYDGARMSVHGTEDAELTTNQVRWAIPDLATGRKWGTAFAGTFADYLPNGSAVVPSIVTVIADDIAGLPASERSATAEVALITELPKTGRRIAWDLLVFATVALGNLVVLGTGALYLCCPQRSRIMEI